jgi:heptosyltransferase-2
MSVNLNCRHFPGDRPCCFHKQLGIECDDCPYFATPEFRVLIIKLDALGDVLRTTCLLPSLKRQHPGCQVTWLTSREAAPVLENNPLIDERLVLDAEGLARLSVEKYDLVLNPDASKKSASLATMADGDIKRGYGLDDHGQVCPLNPEAIEWLEMGGRDDLKRRNRRTYQEHVHAISGLDAAGQGIILHLTDAERSFAGELARGKRLEGEIIVGLNTGASPRWPKKLWPREGFRDLILQIRAQSDWRVLLLGGAAEQETNRWLNAMSYGWAVDPGSDHSLRDYFALIDLCDVIITGDTLGLHAALGLNKKAVALFGPTSPWEIDLYGRGVRVVSELDCVCCYRTDCERSPSCMDLIQPGSVMRALQHLMGAEEASAVGAGEGILVSVE